MADDLRKNTIRVYGDLLFGKDPRTEDMIVPFERKKI